MADFVTGGALLPYATLKPGASQSPKTVAIDEWNSVLASIESVRNFMRPPVRVNLRAIGCVPRDPTKGANNISIINGLILGARAASRSIVFDVDDWFYIDKHGTNWSVYVPAGTRDIFFVGIGRYSCGFIQHGIGTGGDWFGFFFDEVTNCGMHNIGIYQGEIDIPSTGQHDHLIQVACWDGSGTCDVTFSSIYLGKALGDGINIYGGASGKVSATIRDLDINGYGFVLKTWQANKAYAFGSMVRIGTLCYFCTVAGVSGSSEPVGTGGAVVDGTVTWSTIQGGATYRKASRTGLAFQRGYDGVLVEGFRIRGVQNSAIDMEATGSGTCRHACFANGLIDNTLGVTANAMSFSGSGSLTDPTKFSTLDNVLIYNGSLQVAETRDARISRVRVIQEEAPDGDVDTPNLYLIRDNTNLVIESIQLHRRGTSAAGLLLSFSGTGRITLGGHCTFEQATDSDIIGGEPGNDLTFRGDFNTTFSGATPAARSVFNFNAISKDLNDLTIEGFRLESTTGALKSILNVGVRNGWSCDHVTLANTKVQDGSVSLGIFASVNDNDGSYFDHSPMMHNNDLGVGIPLLRVEDESNVELTDYAFAIIEGNRGKACTYVGSVDPTGNCRAQLGSTYIQTSNPAKHYFKAIGSNTSGGWAELTLGTPSVAALTMPGDAAAWTAHLTAFGLTNAAPNLSWLGNDAAGDIAPLIGALSLTASGVVTYGVDETGYPVDQFLEIPDNGAGTGFSTTDASLANPQTTSRLAILIGRLTTVPAAGRGLLHISDDDQIRIANVGGAARARIIAAGADVTPTTDIDTSSVDVFIFQVNETANTIFFATSAFKTTPAYVAAASAAKRVGVGGFNATSAPFRVGALYYWEGANAEMTSAQLKALAESFGAAPAWTP